MRHSLEGRHVRVAVVGAGFAGIGAAMRLAGSGETSFALLERAETVGGTWRDNIYPGVACDVPSHLYSFSFAPKADWTHRFSPGQEILDYLTGCAADPQVRDRLHLGTALVDAQWEHQRARWTLQTSRGTMTASVLVLATGRFTEPRIPEVSGLSGFPGPVFHTARWQPDTQVAGRRVGVVGTGASAVQLVPELVDDGAEVTVFQRTAPWVVPKDDAPYSDHQREAFTRDDAARRAHRERIFAELDSGFRARLSGTAENAQLRRHALEHLTSQVEESPLREALTPSYTIGCKRVLLSDRWYPALSSAAITLENSALISTEGTVARAASGAEHHLDALIFATGFEAHRPPVAELVRGADGEPLSEHWRDGMTAYASTSVSGFPNCFLLGGPHSALGHNSALTIMEVQIDHLLSALDHVPEGTSCEVRPSAELSYTRQLDARAADTVWMSQTCSSWYRDDSSGRVTLLWPGTAQEFAQGYSRMDPAQFMFSDARERSGQLSTRPSPLDDTPCQEIITR